MLRRLFWIVVGAVLALQGDRWMREQRAKWAPSAVTGTLLDKANARLERNQRETARRNSPVV